MTAGAAPVPGRRASLGAAAVLAGYLLLAPSLYSVGPFLLAPFALLALLSRPRTVRELFWLVLAGAGVALSLAGDQTLVPQLLRTGGLVMGAAFVLLSLRSSQTVVARLFLALAISVGGLLIWARVWGVTWAAIEGAFTEIMREIYQAWAQSRPNDADLQLFLQQTGELAPKAARLMPGMLALAGHGGMRPGVGLAPSDRHDPTGPAAGPIPGVPVQRPSRLGCYLYPRIAAAAAPTASPDRCGQSPDRLGWSVHRPRPGDHRGNLRAGPRVPAGHRDGARFTDLRGSRTGGHLARLSGAPSASGILRSMT